MVSTTVEAMGTPTNFKVRLPELVKVVALRVHVTHPYSRVSITSVFSRQTFRLSRAVVVS